MSRNPIILHATCVAIDGHGLLILGPSGAGKSSLALQLIGMGAVLVADDRTMLRQGDGGIFATAPDAIAGKIEARGVGILEVPYLAEACLELVVDLERRETDRLPHTHHVQLLDKLLPCLHKVDAPHFAAAINAYLKGRRSEHA